MQERTKQNIRFVILWGLLLMMMAYAMSSCSSSQQTYTPSKASKSLTVCNHIGCYKK